MFVYLEVLHTLTATKVGGILHNKQQLFYKQQAMNFSSNGKLLGVLFKDLSISEHRSNCCSCNKRLRLGWMSYLIISHFANTRATAARVCINIRVVANVFYHGEFASRITVALLLRCVHRL